MSSITRYKFILSELPTNEGANWAIECHAKDDQKAFVNRNSVMYIQLNENTPKELAAEIVGLLEGNVKNVVFSR